MVFWVSIFVGSDGAGCVWTVGVLSKKTLALVGAEPRKLSGENSITRELTRRLAPQRY